MRENRTHGSEGGEIESLFSTPIELHGCIGFSPILSTGYPTIPAGYDK